MERKGYNGWTNYETWAVKLWIDNEQNTQEYWREQAQRAIANAKAEPFFSRKERAILDLADELKNEHEEMADRQLLTAGVFSDLLNAALSEVNWYEIAEAMVNDAVEEKPELLTD